MLFATLAAQDPQTADLFASLVRQGPQVLAGLSAPQQQAIQAEIGTAFRAAFMTIACFTSTAMLFAWWLPLRRI